MAIVAVEPKREVADWLRKRARGLGIEIDVRLDPADAAEMTSQGGIRVVAGYLDGESRFLEFGRQGGDPTRIVPFLSGSGRTEDHCDRWALFLRAIRSRSPIGGGVDLEHLGRWIDARFEEEMDERHQSLIARLEPIFLELARRDPSIRDHSFRVGLYSARIGEELGLAPLEVRLLRLGGWVHDVGKIKVRTALLRKRGSLEPAEKEAMDAHTTWGSRIMEAHPAETEILGMVRHHHERFDGKGYPEGVVGETIPLLARILAIADTYDAITSDRPYRRAADHREAVREILAGSGTQFDPAVVQAFLTARLDRLSLAVPAA